MHKDGRPIECGGLFGRTRYLLQEVADRLVALGGNDGNLHDFHPCFKGSAPEACQHGMLNALAKHSTAH